jgi:hypothetical protein
LGIRAPSLPVPAQSDAHGHQTDEPSLTYDAENGRMGVKDAKLRNPPLWMAILNVYLDAIEVNYFFTPAGTAANRDDASRPITLTYC